MASDRMTTASQVDAWTMSGSDITGNFNDNGQLAIGPYWGGFRNSTVEATGLFYMDPTVGSNTGEGSGLSTSLRTSGLYRSQGLKKSNPPRPYFRDTGTRECGVKAPYTPTSADVGLETGTGTWSSAYMQFSDAEDFAFGETTFPISNEGDTQSINLGFEPSMVFIQCQNWQTGAAQNSSSTITCTHGVFTS